ncbi:(2Fe-2S)-binding protein [Marinobacter salicampi]|uniref:(2Fe-2S)-binding protein n=1 Tax=Marinobacter salicampi TaxID=435907 RepID=UPI00140C93D7|nr:(2Fe-2S)-binding protein [Marinobacter salicampi]
MAEHEVWLERYDALLQEADVTPKAVAVSMDVAEPEGSLNRQAPGYAPIGLAASLACPEVMTGPLREQRNAEPLRVYASVLHQDLALTIVAPAVTRLLLDGASRVPVAEDIWLAPGPKTPAWQWRPSASAQSVSDFLALIARELNRWYPFFRHSLGVSPGAFWSSVGLGLCAPFSALYDKAPPERLCQEATEWLNQFDCDARRFIDWIPLEFNRHPCAIPQRRGCCLKFKLPNGGYCGTCGIYRKERMAKVVSSSA